MALSVKVGVQLKDVKNIKNEVQSKLDSMSKQLKISPQKINLGNINNLRTELQAKLDQVTKNLKLNLSGINISGVDTAKIKESLGDVKVKPKLDTGQIIADTNTLVSQIRSKVESAISGGTIGKISINTGSNGEFLGAKVTAQLENADTKVIRLNHDLEILGETFNENTAKMANALANQNKYLDSQITKLKSYKQAVQGSGGGSVSKQMELNNALDVQIRKLEQLKSSNELLGNAEKARISETTNALKTQTSQLTRYDSSFKNTFGRMLQYFGSGSVIYGFVNQVKTGVNQIIELDDAMRDLRKVADATTEQLEGFTKVANGMAKEVGASTEGIVKSTEYYSKLGDGIEEASEKAKLANIFANVSDLGIDDATKALITIQKGFNMNSMEDMMTIMDMTNEVGNKFSSSTEDIAEGLKEFSSSSLEAGNSLNESIGMFVAANASIQDASRVGTALKTITMRLRTMSTEIDETGVPAAKLREAIKSITSAAGQEVDIMKDDNTFKSTYEILQELAEVYPKLTDAQRAWMQKNVAGVHQGNVFAGIMKNMKEGIDANSVALDSNGSALKENAIYMDSASAKINEFKESLKEIWINTIDSSAIKGVVEGGTAILNIFNKMTTTFGAFPTVIGTVVAGLTLFNAKFREMQTAYQPTFLSSFIAQLNTYGNSLKSLTESIKLKIAEQRKEIVANQMSGDSIKGMKANLISLNGQLVATTAKLALVRIGAAALSAAFSMGLSLAISGIITVIDNFIHREERLIEKNDELRSSFESIGNDIDSVSSLKEQFESLNKSLKNSSLSAEETASKKKELASVTDQLLQKYPELAGVLGNETVSYEKQVKAIEAVIKAKREEQAVKASEYFSENKINGSEDIDKKIAKLKEYQNKLKDLEKGNVTIRGTKFTKKDLDGWDEGQDVLNKDLSNTRSKIQELKKQMQDIIMYNEQLKNYSGQGIVSDSEITKIQNLIGNIELMKGANDNAKNSIDDMSNAMDNQANKAKDATTALQEYADSINGTDWSKDLSPTEIYGKAISEVETLQGYINDMNSETGYTAQLVSEIAQKYPEIGARVTDAEQVQQFLNDKIAEQVGIQNQAYEIMIGNDNDYYSAKIKNNQDYQNALNGFLGLFTDNQGKAYSIDLSLYNNLNEAKSVALNKFGQGVDNFLKQFVYGNDQAYRIDVANFNNLAQAKAQTISSLSGMLAKLQNQTAIAFTEQANAMNEMKALANGSWINGTGKNGTNQMNVFEGAKEQKREIKALQNKISQLEQISSSGLSPGGYTGTSFNGTSFSPTTSGFGGGSGSKGGSGSGSAKEGTYLQDLYDRYSELQKAIDRCANAYDLLEEKKKNASDKDKLKYIKEQIDLINKQKDAVNALRNEQQKQYNELKSYLEGKGFNINSDGAITNYSRIKELTAWAGTNDDRKEEVEAINDAIEEFNDLVQNDMPKSRKEFESLTNTVAELNEEMKDIYKSELELVTDAQEEIVDIIKDRLDKQKELLDKEYEDRKESLEKTKKLYQDQNAEEDYAEELAEEQKKLDEMKNSLIDLQRDVSGNSDALIADMKKQIEEQEKVIRDKQKQYERDKTEQALDQAIEDIENEKEAMDKQWNEQYSEANIVQMATQALNTGLINLNGEVVSLQDAMIAFENSTGQGKLYTSPYVQKCA